MRKVILGLVMVFMVGAHSNAHAQTMLKQHQDFEECMSILDDQSDTIDHMLHMLHMSSMTSSPNGWISYDIVENAEAKINFYLDAWQYAFTHVHNANPDTCRQQVNELVNWVRNQTNTVLALH